jgi:hypothetical protein
MEGSEIHVPRNLSSKVGRRLSSVVISGAHASLLTDRGLVCNIYYPSDVKWTGAGQPVNQFMEDTSAA